MFESRERERERIDDVERRERDLENLVVLLMNDEITKEAFIEKARALGARMDLRKAGEKLQAA